MSTEPLKVEGWSDLAQILGVLRGSSESIPSVVLKTTAASVVQIEVKVYNPDVNLASADAQAIFDDLRQKYISP